MNFKRTLCLNADYQPIQIISSKVAIKSYFKGKCQILEEYEDEYFHTPTTKYAVPSIIRLTEYKKVKYRKVPFTRRNIYLRDDYRCAYSGEKIENPKDLSIDHVHPVSKGGKNTWTNVVTCHQTVNEQKGDKILGEDPEVEHLPVPKPYRPHYLLLMQRGRIPESWKPYLYL